MTDSEDEVMALADRYALEFSLAHGDQFLSESARAALESKVRELEKDAARYRWLRSKAHQDTAYDLYGNGCHWFIGFHNDDSRLSFDAAIDSARGPVEVGGKTP